MSQDIAVALLRAVDHSVIGPAEMGQAAGLAALLRVGHALTAAQTSQATRILSRYATELAAAGIEIPAKAYPAPAGSCIPDVTAPQAQPGPDTPIARIRNIVTNAGKASETRESRIAVSNAYRFKDALKALPDAKPHKDDQGFVWHYPVTPASAAAVARLLAPAKPFLSERVREMVDAFDGQADARTLLDESTPVPHIDTAGLVYDQFRLWDHQARAVEFNTRMVASLDAIPMGGGKTLSTICAINKAVADRPPTGETARVIIVCPNAVRGVWPREVRKFSVKKWHIVNGKKPSRRARSGWVDIAGAGTRLAEAEQCLFDCRCGAEVHAVVVNYDILAREPWKTWRPAKSIDFVIYDEVHKLKSPTGVVSKVCAKWVAWSRKRVGLSGTPMPQTPLDIFGVYRALDPGIFGMSWTLFRARYAVTNPHIEQQVVGYRNMGELAEKFFSIAYRPTVDLDLPPVVDVTRECVLEPAARKIYNDLDDQLWASLTGIDGSPDVAALRRLDAELDALDEIDFDDWDPREKNGTVTPANIMVKLLRLQQLTGGTIIDDEGNRVRVSHAKQKLFADVLDEVGCRPDEPVVAFCRFRSDLDAVAEVARAKGLTYGEVSGRSKTGLTADSEMAEYDVVGVQIQSGGTGVDLTRSRVGVWYSLGYSLSDYDQARKRMDRPGQTRSVTFVHLLAEDTADFEVYGALDARRSVIHGVMESHDIDPATIGLREEVVSEGAHGDGQGVAVSLPFEALLAAENARIGEPMRSSV